MFSKIHVNKNALDYFRKIARKGFPNEVQAYLAGKIKSVNEIEITDFLYTTSYAKQSTWEVAWFEEDFTKAKEKIEKEGKTIVGEIHSHPNFDAVMSKTDFDASITQQFVICGICSIKAGRTNVRFWTPNSALPCKVYYT